MASTGSKSSSDSEKLVPAPTVRFETETSDHSSGSLVQNGVDNEAAVRDDFEDEDEEQLEDEEDELEYPFEVPLNKEDLLNANFDGVYKPTTYPLKPPKPR